MNWLCKIVGCGWDENAECPRCGEGGYDGFNYVQHGLLYPVQLRLWLFRQWLHAHNPARRCDVCRRRLWTWKAREFVCSEKCRAMWLPF